MNLKYFKIICLFILLFLLGEKTYAASLSLEDFVNLVWAQNNTIKEYRLKIKTALVNIKQQEGIYDLNLQANIGKSNYSSTSNISSDALTSQFSLSQKLNTGGNLSLNLGANKTSSSTQPYGATSSLALSQPLASGFGQIITDYPIIIARLDYEKSIESCSSSIQTLLKEAITEYNNYFISQKLKEVVLKNIERTKAIFEEHKKKEALYLLTAQDVLSAEIEYKKAIADLFSAEDNILKCQENLSQFINATQTEQQNFIQELTPAEPKTTTFNQAESLELMRKQNPSLKMAKIDLQKTELAINYDRNKLLPVINLNLAIGYNNYSQSFSGITNFSNPSYSFGLSFQDFWGNREKNAILEKDRIQLDSQTIAEQKLQNNLRIQLSNAIRSFSVQHKNVEITKEVLGLSDQLIKQEMEKFKLGLIQSYKLLDTERSYRESEWEYYLKLGTYLESYYQILVLEGDLLNRYNISLF
ncbi:MAG: TolC family protein [Candidatus Margulisiibacteriota bacterium]|jgi:outer membrane protein TolC